MGIIKYEDLYNDPFEVMKTILQSVNLSLDTQVEKFIQKSTTENSSRYYGLYKNKESIDTWRHSMPISTQNRILEIVSNSTAGNFYKDH